MALLSVIIPVYNVQKYLCECLDCVLSQSYEHIEILIVDDGSTDKSADIIKEYAARESRIHYFHQHNQGAAFARNVALHKARGEYVCFLDPDDIYPSKHTLALLMEKAKDNKALICGGCFADYKDGKLYMQFPPELYGYSFENEGFISYKEWQFDFGFHRFVYKREFLLAQGIEFPNYKRYQDPVFFVRAMMAAGQFYAINEITYSYRVGHQRRENWSLEQWFHQLLAMQEILKFANNHSLQKLYELTLFRLYIESGILLDMCLCGRGYVFVLVKMLETLEANKEAYTHLYGVNFDKDREYMRDYLQKIDVALQDIDRLKLYHCKLGRFFTKILKLYAHFKARRKNQK